MKRLFAYLLPILLAFSSCITNKFRIEGNITGADGQTIFLEQLATGKTIMIDSVVLKSDGKFCFKEQSTEYAELYRLRVGRHQLILAVDSTETIHIDCEADSLNYTIVEGSAITNQITTLRRSLSTSTLDEHKQYAQQVILSNPRSLAAYYALLQMKSGQVVFDLYDKSDRPYFSAVATAWNAFMPNNPRSKSVYRLTLDAIKNERRDANHQVMQQFIEESENAFLDFSLPDKNGKLHYLSDLRGKVIILDFSAVAMEQSSAYIFELREIYNKFHKQGLEIFSVSADRNALLWENTAQNLPWITVRGENGAAEKPFLMYNVQTIPTLFLFNKQGEIVGRYSDFTSLTKAVEQCLN